MSATEVSAIVLAGGRSSRFGRDKLAEPLDGRPLLAHAIDAVRPLVAQVVVVAAPGAAPGLPDDVELVHDATPYEGPLAGLRAGLSAATEPTVIVVGGDMPTLDRAILVLLLAELDRGADVAVLAHEGRSQPLPMALRRVTALTMADRLLATGVRRLGALAEGPSVRVIPEADWRTVDPEGRTLHDIDTPADLGR